MLKFFRMSSPGPGLNGRVMLRNSAGCANGHSSRRPGYRAISSHGPISGRDNGRISAAS